MAGVQRERCAETSLGACELVQDAVAGFVDEMVDVRSLLDSRYDDLKSPAPRESDAFTDLDEIWEFIASGRHPQFTWRNSTPRFRIPLRRWNWLEQAVLGGDERAE